MLLGLAFSLLTWLPLLVDQSSCTLIIWICYGLVELDTWKGLWSVTTSRWWTSLNLCTLSNIDVMYHVGLVVTSLICHSHWLIVLCTKTIMSKSALLPLRCSNSVQKSVLNISTTSFILGVELRNIILSRFWKGCCNIVHTILINDIGFKLPTFGSIVSN